MTDPLAVFPQHPDGGLDHGAYYRCEPHLADDAVKLGWIPAPGRVSTLCDQYVVWMKWVKCECGRGMPIPTEGA